MLRVWHKNSVTLVPGNGVFRSCRSDRHPGLDHSHWSAALLAVNGEPSALNLYGCGRTYGQHTVRRDVIQRFENLASAHTMPTTCRALTGICN